MAFPTTHSFARYLAIPRKWDDLAREHVYDDEGRSFNTVSDTATIRWEVAFTGLSAAEAADYDTFWNTTKLDGTFDFTDKQGVVWTGVRIEDYKRNHSGHKSWINSVSFILAKYN